MTVSLIAERPLRTIHGAANGCARCGQQFGSLKSFDKHQDVDYDRVVPPRGAVHMDMSRAR
jgi:hypothetical protein